MTNIFEFNNKHSLWGDSYCFHYQNKNNKTFLVIADKSTNKFGTYYSLDFCTHESFEKANELLYYLSFPSYCNKEKFNSLLKNSGGGKDSSLLFFAKTILFYKKLCDFENSISSCVNIFISNIKGMQKIIDFCLKNGFILLGNCLSYRSENFIPIHKRKRLMFS